MQSFFAAVAAFWGRLSRPGATAIGDPGAPAEPPATPAPGGVVVAATSQLEAAATLEAASGRTEPAGSESPEPSISGASPSGSSSQITTEGRRRSRKGAAAAADRLCPWCSAAVRASDAVCPSCGATLDGAAADRMAIPGLTEVPPALRRYAENAKSGKKRQSLLKMILSDEPIPPAIDAPLPSDEDALRPPSAALRAEMARLDLDIAASVAPRPVDDASPVAPAGPAEQEDSAPRPAAPEPSGGDQRT